MEGEPPVKRRRTNKQKETDKPTIVTEIAEPLEREEGEERGRNRIRQLTIDEPPFEFLPADVKAKIEQTNERIALEELEKQETEKNAKLKAKTLLGVFIGAGIGMYFAYLVKNKFFPAVETAAQILEETITEQ